tara:strand:+ start:1277 stop:1792 length:516 start_codon:yes stop_codon:yes gene_type:complete
MEFYRKYINLNSIDLKKMTTLGRAIAKSLSLHNIRLVYLKGELGSGKTSFVRTVISELGVYEVIPSPSFSIVEVYETKNHEIVHIDMFRIDSPEAWRSGEIRSYIENEKNLIFLEWPDKSSNLPDPDLLIEFFWLDDYNPESPRKIKISGKALSKIKNSIYSLNLEKFHYE